MDESITPSEISSFFSSLHVVIFEPNASVKVTLRAVLKELGVSSDHIDYVDSISKLYRVIEEKIPQIIIASDEIKNISFRKIIDCHRAFVPRRLNCALVAISGNNSKANASTFSEEEIDIALIKPFSTQNAIDKFREYFERAYRPDAFLTSIDDAVELLNLKKFDDSIEALKILHDKDPNRPLITYLLGECYRRQNQLDDALKYYQKTIELAEDHFMSYSRMYDIYLGYKQYELAHKCASEILKRYPINPMRLESLIRLDIATQSYENLYEYSKLPDLFEHGQAAKGLAAGLAIGASAMIKMPDAENKTTLIKAFLDKSSQLGYDFPLILQSVVHSYIDIGELKLADMLLSHIMIELKYVDNVSKELEASILFKSNIYGKALLKTLEIFKESYFSENLYIIALESSLKLNRKAEFIRELYQDGVSKFPSLKTFEETVRNLE